MSETNTGVEDNSASKERAAGEAKRSAHGSGIGVIMRFRAIHAKAKADDGLTRAKMYGETEWANFELGKKAAFQLVLEWLDDLMMDAATLTQEGTSPTS